MDLGYLRRNRPSAREQRPTLISESFPPVATGRWLRAANWRWGGVCDTGADLEPQLAAAMPVSQTQARGRGIGSRQGKTRRIPAGEKRLERGARRNDIRDFCRVRPWFNADLRLSTHRRGGLHLRWKGPEASKAWCSRKALGQAGARTGSLGPQVGAGLEIGASSRARRRVFGMGVWWFGVCRVRGVVMARERAETRQRRVRR